MTDRRISDVVAELRAIAARAEETRSRVGFFATLYARVTAAVAARIREGFFEDGPRMERLDVMFADLYIEAVKRRLSGAGGVSRAWTVAFDACDTREPIILQHLYLGMNAHLLVDLPVAIASTISRGAFGAAKRDFLRINDIVAAEMNGFHDHLCAVSPRLAQWKRAADGLWTAGSKGILFVAREWAFRCAGTLAAAPEEERGRLVDAFDRRAAAIGEKVVLRPRLGAGVFRAIRVEEMDDVQHIVRVLRGDRSGVSDEREGSQTTEADL